MVGLGGLPHSGQLAGFVGCPSSNGETEFGQQIITQPEDMAQELLIGPMP